MDPSDFLCPKCKKEPMLGLAATIREWSMRRLDLPHFECVECRLCYYDKRLIRQWISNWRNSDNSKLGAKRVPYNLIYNEVKKFLDEVMDYYVRIGYRFIKFDKKEN